MEREHHQKHEVDWLWLPLLRGTPMVQRDPNILSGRMT
jgi:hypothetical protein